MDKSGKQRFSIFEFRDNLHMKVLTKDRSKPKNWTDGEVMMYKYQYLRKEEHRAASLQAPGLLSLTTLSWDDRTTK